MAAHFQALLPNRLFSGTKPVNLQARLRIIQYRTGTQDDELVDQNMMNWWNDYASIPEDQIRALYVTREILWYEEGRLRILYDTQNGPDIAKASQQFNATEKLLSRIQTEINQYEIGGVIPTLHTTSPVSVWHNNKFFRPAPTTVNILNQLGYNWEWDWNFDTLNP